MTPTSHSRILAALFASSLAGFSAAQPANDTCAGAIPITTIPSIIAPLSLTAAARDEDLPACEWMAYTVWYSIEVPESTDIIIETCSASLPGITVQDTVLALYQSPDGTCNNLTLATCDDDTCGLRSRISARLLPGTRHYLQAGVRRSTFNLPAPAAPSNLLSISIQRISEPPAGTWQESLPFEPQDTGSLPATAQVVTTPSLTRIEGFLDTNDVDMYRLDICDPVSFSASLISNAFFDTQLFLFDAGGKPIWMNDDQPGTASKASILQANLESPPLALVPAGNYFLAVSSYDQDPLNAGSQPLWLDTPFRTVRTSDGPGANTRLSQWDSLGGSGGPYIITLTGTSPAGTCSILCPPCEADFDNNGGVDGGDVEAFFPAWEVNEPCADVNFDGGVDGQDVEFFFVAWEAGGC